MGLAVSVRPTFAWDTVNGEPKWPELDERPRTSERTQVGPNRQCDWVYSGLRRFKNATTDGDITPRQNPFVTVSRRGLTARVIGTLTDDFVAAHGGSIAAVAKEFPWVVPVRQTAVHRVRAENGSLPARQRPIQGEIVSTEVVALPPNSVMIVYPVATANRAAGANTLAGNWIITHKDRGKPNNAKGAFGRFPFLLYTGSNGHALHGPITKLEVQQRWFLKRGEVSHGCNRMEGEHVTELAVLLGCDQDPRHLRCPNPSAGPLDDERVTVMEDFDHVPDPAKIVPVGPVTSWDRNASDWVAVDVDYPREREPAANLRTTVDGHDAFLVQKTEVPVHGALTLRRRVFPTWDNRDRHLVVGQHCR
jgi:hypothetical protein